MTQQGILTQMQSRTLSQNIRDGFSLGGMSQDFLGEDFKSQGSHAGYSGQEFATQAGFGMDSNTQANQSGYGGDFITQNSQPGLSHQSVGSDFISQDFLSHATDGLFTQGGFNNRTQDLPSTQNHSGLGGLQTQNALGPMYTQNFTQYNQPLNSQQQQQAGQRRFNG